MQSVCRAQRVHRQQLEMGEDTIDRVHRDLKIIAALREGDKVYVADGNLCVLHPSAYNFAWRWFRGDNRIKSLAMIHSTLVDALAVAENSIERILHRNSKHSSGTPFIRDPATLSLESTVRRICKEIKNAIVGLKYMRITYTGDHSTTAKIDVLREGVTERLDAIYRWLRDMGITDPDLMQQQEGRRRGLQALESYAGCIILSEEDLHY